MPIIDIIERILKNKLEKKHNIAIALFNFMNSIRKAPYTIFVGIEKIKKYKNNHKWIMNVYIFLKTSFHFLLFILILGFSLASARKIYNNYDFFPDENIKFGIIYSITSNKVVNYALILICVTYFLYIVKTIPKFVSARKISYKKDWLFIFCLSILGIVSATAFQSIFENHLSTDPGKYQTCTSKYVRNTDQYSIDLMLRITSEGKMSEKDIESAKENILKAKQYCDNYYAQFKTIDNISTQLLIWSISTMVIIIYIFLSIDLVTLFFRKHYRLANKLT